MPLDKVRFKMSNTVPTSTYRASALVLEVPSVVLFYSSFFEEPGIIAYPPSGVER